MNKNDPRLTGFVLGEISAEDAKIVKDAIHTDKQIAKEVAAIEATVNQINDTLGNTQPKLTVEQRKKIFSSTEPSQDNVLNFAPKSSRRTGILVFIAGVAAIFVAIFSLSSNRDNSSIVASFKHFTPELLSSRLALPSESDDIPVTSLSSQKLQKAISLSPSAFRNVTKSITNNLPVNVSTAPLNHKKERVYKSYILPLTSGLSSWSAIKESTKVGASLDPTLVRTEELVNISTLLPSFSYKFKGIDTALEFTHCPWDSKATLVVINLKNNTKSPINNVSVTLSVSEDAPSLEILGYPATSKDILTAPSSYNFQPNHSHTLIAKIDLEQISVSLESLASLNINAGESSQKISYDFSQTSLKTASHATKFSALTSYWAHYIKSDNQFKSQNQAPLKQSLEEFKSNSADAQMINICNILLQNI